MTLKEKLAELERQLTQLRKERDDYRVRQTVEKEQLEKRIGQLETDSANAEHSLLFERQRADFAQGQVVAYAQVLAKNGLVDGELASQLPAQHGRVRTGGAMSYLDGEAPPRPKWRDR